MPDCSLLCQTFVLSMAMSCSLGSKANHQILVISVSITRVSVSGMYTTVYRCDMPLSFSLAEVRQKYMAI